MRTRPWLAGYRDDETVSHPTLINGCETDLVSVSDRGLQYGDGLFETLLVREGYPCLWAEHFARLTRGCDRLGIPPPPEALLLGECRRLARHEAAAVLKVILTRGVGHRGYRQPLTPKPTRIVTLYRPAVFPISWERQGIHAIFCRTLLGENPMLAGLKHLNRLEQVLARSEWRDETIAEGIMRDCRGRLIGGTMTNLFMVRGGCLITPRLDTCGIAGTVRALVFRIAAGCGIHLVEADIGSDDFNRADALFLTNALIGVWPVRRLGDKDIGLDKLPRDLISAVRDAVRTPFSDLP